MVMIRLDSFAYLGGFGQVTSSEISTSILGSGIRSGHGTFLSTIIFFSWLRTTMDPDASTNALGCSSAVLFSIDPILFFVCGREGLVVASSLLGSRGLATITPLRHGTVEWSTTGALAEAVQDLCLARAESERNVSHDTVSGRDCLAMDERIYSPTYLHTYPHWLDHPRAWYRILRWPPDQWMRARLLYT